jgi:hypothetical protein
MSHVSEIHMEESYHLPSLKQMCRDMEWEWRENQNNYRWFGLHVGDYPIPKGFSVSDMGKCNHAIRIPGADYEVGVVYKNGEWKLLWDFWGAGGLQRVLGKEGGLLKQAYGIAKAKFTARRNGKFARVKQGNNGWKKVVIEI